MYREEVNYVQGKGQLCTYVQTKSGSQSQQLKANLPVHPEVDDGVPAGVGDGEHVEDGEHVGEHHLRQVEPTQHQLEYAAAGVTGPRI